MYWFPFEPLPEKAHIASLRVDLGNLRIPQGIDTFPQVIDALPRLGPSFVVIDSIDAIATGEGAVVTAGLQGVHPYLKEMASLRGELAANKTTVVLISQIRSNPNRNYRRFSSLYNMGHMLSAAVRLHHVSRSTKFGEKSWSSVEITATINTSTPPGQTGTLVLHPTLGMCPEAEMMDWLREKHGSTWRSTLGLKLPNGREAAVAFIRENEDVYHEMWRLL